MKNFKHYNATSLDEAFFLMNEFGERARFIAGGTDLLGVLKSDIHPVYPEALINLKTILELDFIKEDEGVLRIGALTRLSDIVRSPLVKEHYPALAEAAESIASPEIRNMGTIGGNLCQENRCWYYRYPHSMGGRIQCFRKGKGPCLALKGDNRYHAIIGGKKCFAVCPSDMAIVLSAMDAKIKVSKSTGEREITIGEFYGTLDHVLEQGEILKEIDVVRPSPDTKQRFLKFRLRESIDFAIVSVAAVFRQTEGICRDARIILGGVSPTPYRAVEAEDALNDRPLDAAVADAVAEAAMSRAKPLSMNAYKIEITKTLVKRSLLS